MEMVMKMFLIFRHVYIHDYLIHRLESYTIIITTDDQSYDKFILNDRFLKYFSYVWMLLILY